jgi:hypothetical protein
MNSWSFRMLILSYVQTSIVLYADFKNKFVLKLIYTFKTWVYNVCFARFDQQRVFSLLFVCVCTAFLPASLFMHVPNSELCAQWLSCLHFSMSLNSQRFHFLSFSWKHISNIHSCLYDGMRSYSYDLKRPFTMHAQSLLFGRGRKCLPMEILHTIILTGSARKRNTLFLKIHQNQRHYALIANMTW